MVFRSVSNAPSLFSLSNCGVSVYSSSVDSVGCAPERSSSVDICPAKEDALEREGEFLSPKFPAQPFRSPQKSRSTYSNISRRTYWRLIQEHSSYFRFINLGYSSFRVCSFALLDNNTKSVLPHDGTRGTQQPL